MITIRHPDDLFHAGGPTARGSFEGLWHFSFDMYHDPQYMHFGTLRVLNDDIISEGGEWGIHPHKRNEVLTYVMRGEFTHEDEHGEGGTMKKGAMQHTTIGMGMLHNEINASEKDKMRFIQMWFFPDTEGLSPSVTQYTPEKSDRTNKLLLLASKDKEAPLRIRSDVNAYVSFLENGKELAFDITDRWGVYLANLEGGTLKVNDRPIPERGAAKVEDEKQIIIKAEKDCELLLLEVLLYTDYIDR
jgi:redox-sensitive bicupin YhaK (pirin superfamily)